LPPEMSLGGARPSQEQQCVSSGHLLIMEQRVRRRPEGMRQRQQLVEHPLGTMQRWWDAGDFFMRGLEKVRTECRLTVLASNLRRVLHLVEMPRRLAALG